MLLLGGIAIGMAFACLLMWVSIDLLSGLLKINREYSAQQDKVIEAQGSYIASLESLRDLYRELNGNLQSQINLMRYRIGEE